MPRATTELDRAAVGGVANLLFPVPMAGDEGFLVALVTEAAVAPPGR